MALKKPNPDKLFNFYNIMPDSMKPKVPNPHFDKHGLSLPMRMVLIGASGAGKSNTLTNLLFQMPDTFTKIVLCCQDSDEPLYRFLKACLKPDELDVREGIENVPDLSELDKGEDNHTLLIYDDLCLAKNQKKIEEAFIRGRKVPVSIIYSSQSYFHVPKICRLNASHIILKKLHALRDLKLLLTDHNLGVDREDLLHAYQECTREPLDFLMVAAGDVPERRFRHNLTDIIELGNKDEGDSSSSSSNDDDDDDGDSSSDDDKPNTRKDLVPKRSVRRR
jgi:hypothetical protein